MTSVQFFGTSDMGQVRTNNEDAFLAQNIWDDNHILAVAIDGVGGYEGGEVAADLAQTHIVKYLESNPDGEHAELLKRAVTHANNTIFEERIKQPEYSNMSCVLTAAIVDISERLISMAHVGDTRLYQFTDGKIEKLSHDHSLIGYREEVGDLSEEEAMKHPQRNIIGRDVGSEMLDENNKKYIEVETFPLLAHSTLLFCSDGLCDMITSSQMASVLATEESIEDKVMALIKKANAAGGKDNVTVVLVESNIEEESLIIETIDCTPTSKEIQEENSSLTIEDIKPKKSGFSRRHLRATILAICYVVLFIAGYFIGYDKAKSETSPKVVTCKQSQIDDYRIEQDSIVVPIMTDSITL